MECDEARARLDPYSTANLPKPNGATFATIIDGVRRMRARSRGPRTAAGRHPAVGPALSRTGGVALTDPFAALVARATAPRPWRARRDGSPLPPRS